MCSEIDQFSSFLRRMSGGNNPQFFPHLEKQDDKEAGAIEPNSPQPMSENLPEIVTAAQGKGNLDGADDDQKKEQLEEFKNDEETDKATVSSREPEKQIAEDDDGFKTPTSSDHRIPATTQCPQAPKKPRQQTSKLKRKASPPPGARRSLQFDATTEVESIFRPIPDQDNIEEQKTKKARREDDEDSS